MDCNSISVYVGGLGLAAICRGLILNTKLEKLGLADNMIEQSPDDLYALELFRSCLQCPTVELTAVDMMWNRIGEQVLYCLLSVK